MRKIKEQKVDGEYQKVNLNKITHLIALNAIRLTYQLQGKNISGLYKNSIHICYFKIAYVK